MSICIFLVLQQPPLSDCTVLDMLYHDGINVHNEFTFGKLQRF